MALAFLAGYTPTEKVKMSRETGLQALQSDSGTMRYIDFGPDTYWTLDMQYGPMSEADRITLENWLVTNEKVEIDLPVLSETYTGRIVPSAGIGVTTTDGGALWYITFKFRGIKQ